MATRVASIVAEIGINTGNFDKKIQSVMKSLGMTGKEFQKFGVAIGSAAVVVGAVAMAMKKAVDVTVTYADEVRTLSSITNQSAETTSRMIQVLDDYGLSAEQAGMAAKFLAKEGLSLNVETIAKLSDEYKALNTGQERAEFLMKNFGKAGQDFTLIMEEGSEAILDRGEAVKDGLILSQKELKAAQDLKYAMDDLNDTQQALTITVGNEVIPVWSRYLDSLNDVLSGTSALDVVWKNFLWTLDQLRGRGDMNITTLEEMATAQTDYYNSLTNLPPAIDDVGASIGALTSAEESFLTSTREMTPKAVAEFVAIEEKIAKVKEMIAAGASFNVIVNFLAGKTIMVDPNSMSLWQPGGPPEKPAVPTFGTEATFGNQKAVGGPLGKGMTLVGEMGPELIDKSGMVINAHNTRRMLDKGVVPGRRFSTGGASGAPPPWQAGLYGSTTNLYGDGGYNLADDWVMMNMPGAPSNWVSNYNSSQGGSGGGSGAVMQTAAAASQAAKNASISVDVTAQMAAQQARAAVTNVALLKSIDQRLAELPRAIRDAVQMAV